MLREFHSEIVVKGHSYDIEYHFLTVTFSATPAGSNGLHLVSDLFASAQMKRSEVVKNALVCTS
jgi:hypothetical protein